VGMPTDGRKEGVLSRLEEEDGDLAEVEIDKVLGFVGDIRTKVTAHNRMPCGVVLLVELLLHIRCDILLNVVFV